MTGQQAIRPVSAKTLPSGVLRLDFDPDTAFQAALEQRVDEYFHRTGLAREGGWRLYLKTVFILIVFASSYGLLVFAAETIWQALPLAVLLGLATACIGFDIQHDGGHRSYSSRPWVNRLAAFALDTVGGSSYVWHWKHTVIHHRYANITWFDNDINLGALGRLSPHHRRLWYYRWQNLYLWPLYGLEAMKLQFVDDFKYIIRGKLGYHRIPRPTRWELVVFITGKVIFFSWAFVIPMLWYPVWVVCFYYVVAASVLGVVMILVFVMPHTAGETDFPLPAEDTGRMATPWAVHQARCTMDFARHNRVLTWLLGGLNYHKEHHLFPLISHVHYPAISILVEETCREFGVPYGEHRSFPRGIASHYRWLRQMGKAD
jgi:linoleoyl-CoA desaturase